MHSVACLTLFVTSLTIAACNIGSGTQEPIAVADEEREPIPPSVTSLITRAQMASAEGKHSARLRFADEAVRRVPTFGRGHFVRDEILTALCRLEDAREAYEVVRQIDPAFPFINIRLGSNAVSRGRGWSRGAKLGGFAIAGTDGRFVWADARIDGNTVVVSNASVKNPVAVRYAWADNPDRANLYNREGLPAAPFRTSF